METEQLFLKLTPKYDYYDNTLLLISHCVSCWENDFPIRIIIKRTVRKVALLT